MTECWVDALDECSWILIHILPLRLCCALVLSAIKEKTSVKLKAGVSFYHLSRLFRVAVDDYYSIHLKAHLLTLFLNRSSSALALLRLCWCCSSSFWEGGGAVGRAAGLLWLPCFNLSRTPMPSRLPGFRGGREAEPSDSSLSSSLEDCCGRQDRS